MAVRCFSRWFQHAARFGEHPTLAARLSDRAGLRDLLGQVVVGNFLHIPFIFLPSFYLLQVVLDRGVDASPKRALQTYARNAHDDLKWNG